MVKEPNSFIEKMPLSEKVYRILAKKIIDTRSTTPIISGR